MHSAGCWAPRHCLPEKGTAEFPEGTEFIIVSVNMAVGVYHVRAPLHGDKIRWRLVGNGAAVGGVELLQQVPRLQQRFRTLIGVEGKGVEEGWGKLPQIAIPCLEEIEIVRV